MIQIDYDILFSVRAFLLTADGQPSNKIAADSWHYAPSAATRRLMEARKMLFRNMNGVGLLLAPPTSYVLEGGHEVAIFELEKPLKFTIEVRLGQAGLNRYLERSDGDLTAGQQAFFEQAFPGRRPAYVLDNERLHDPSPVGAGDAVAPPTGRLHFDKARYPEIILKGPLPALDTIPSASLVDVVDGEAVELANELAFEYNPAGLPEGTYQLSGSKLQEDNSSLAFTGEIFLNGGHPGTSPLAYLDIEIPAGQTRTGERAFVLRFRERNTATENGDENE